MWTREVDGQVLTFHLAGINNQNFLMRDEETGSFWQQINGKCVSGALKGKELKLVSTEELSFGLWKQENPRGEVLQPVSEFQKWYEKKDWDVEMAKAPSIIDTKKTGVEPRTLMVGVEVNGAARAFPLQAILDAKLVQDRVGGRPIFLVAGPDGKSIRAFVSEGEIFRNTDGRTAFLTDAATGSDWDFKGCAVAGPSKGHCLTPVGTISDYWFDWQIYHPQTTVYRH